MYFECELIPECYLVLQCVLCYIQVWFKNRRARWRKQKKERQVKQYQDIRLEESTLRHECFVNDGEKHKSGLQQTDKEKVTSSSKYWTGRNEAEVYHIEKRQ